MHTITTLAAESTACQRDLRRFLATMVVQGRVFRHDEFAATGSDVAAIEHLDSTLAWLKANVPVDPADQLSPRQEQALQGLAPLSDDVRGGGLVPQALLSLDNPLVWHKPILPAELRTFARIDEILVLATSPRQSVELLAQQWIGSLRAACPTAPVDVATSCPELWQGAHAQGIREVTCFARANDIAPFAIALDRARKNPQGLLLVFLESDRGATFGSFAALSSLSAFVYFDTENARIRVVDPVGGVSTEVRGRWRDHHYSVAMDDALEQLGLGPVVYAAPAPRPGKRALIDLTRGRGRWLFDAEWVAAVVRGLIDSDPGCLAEIAIYEPPHCQVHGSGDKVEKILAGLEVKLTRLTELTAALAFAVTNTVIFGVEGALSSLARVRPVLSLTVSSARFTHGLPRSTSSLLLVDQSSVALASRVVARYLAPPQERLAHVGSQLGDAVKRICDCGTVGKPLKALGDAVEHAASLIRAWAATDPQLAREFDESVASAVAFYEAAEPARGSDELVTDPMERLVRTARGAWIDSNFGRYVEWLAASVSKA